MPARLAGALALAMLVLPACGLKGPLYLPEQPGEVVTRPTQTAEPAAEEPVGQETPREEKPKDDESADPPL